MTPKKPRQEGRPVRLLYVEPFSGISGDMMLGALLDLGQDFSRLREKLRLLGLGGYDLALTSCSRSGIQAAKFNVRCEGQPPREESDREPGRHARGEHVHDGHGQRAPSHEPNDHGMHDHTTPGPGAHDHEHRSFREIRAMIESSGLSDWVKSKSVEAFRRLAEAEGKIHNQHPDEVHFHEVGAVDSIVDIVGTAVAIEELMPVRLISAPVNVGQGTLECRHGVYPAPGPAAVELLKGIPIYSTAVAGELATPTGAALLVTFADSFGPRPLMRMDRVGYGAGDRDIPGASNVLRLTLGSEVEPPPLPVSPEEVAVIEANLDDMNPQVYGYFQEKALSAGALDVFVVPAQMKKNRPGTLLTVVCDPDRVDVMSDMIFAETTTIGVRYALVRRKTLERRFIEVETEFGTVAVKVSFRDGRRVNFVPEYECCRRLAMEKDAALKDVMAAASRAFLELERAGPTGENR